MIKPISIEIVELYMVKAYMVARFLDLNLTTNFSIDLFNCEF